MDVQILTQQMSKLPLSVVVIAKNESINIRRCIEAVSWCDDIVVIDDYSHDETIQLAVQSGARVLTHRFESFASQRNWALENAELRHQWALMLDADEVVTQELHAELAKVLLETADDIVGFRMCRKTMFQDTWLRFSDGFPVWIVRIVRIGKFQFQDSGHGEVAVPDVEGRLGTVLVPFLHYPFSKGMHDWWERHNRYSTREAELEMLGVQNLEWKCLFSTDRAIRRKTLRTISRRLPCRAFLRFLYQFIWKRGFLEGRSGLTFSWMMAVYEGMIVLKIHEIESIRKGKSL